jgi:GNAT superfamily N-acetyltransferase
MLEERIKVGEVEWLDRFHATELDCDVELLQRPGVHLVPSPRRTRPGWGGYTVPVLALSTRRGGVVSIRPDLAPSAQPELADAGADEPLGEPHFERLRRLARRAVPYVYSLSGYALYCDRHSFRPAGNLAERLGPTDPRGRDLRRRFDGEIFAIFGIRGEIASWSAIKLKSDEVWEIAVVTDAAYRGQGLAKEVVSAATAHILEQGRTALYVHDRNNHASARVCRSLGYVEYAEEYFSEY